jgi:predicted dehydrogenase
MSTSNEEKGSSRREFLRTAAATAAASVAAAGVAKSSVYSIAPARVLGAADRIRIAHVGLGVQGYGAHVTLFKENSADYNTEQVAVCDLYARRNRRAADKIGRLKESAWYADHRKLLERKDIDAVVVATSDQWHAPIALACLNAGKHVYCEKPMCKTLEEAFLLFDTVKKTGRKFQVGSQGCSDPMYKNINAIVTSGKIGTMIMGQHSYNRGDNRIGEWNSYGDNPFKDPVHKNAGPMGKGDDHIDWETYRKGSYPAEWNPDRFFRFRKYWNYGNGLVGDLMPHRLHPMAIAMGIPTKGLEGFPMRVSSGGGLYVQKVNPDTGKPDREVPDFTYITVDFGKYSLIVMSTCINEQGMRPMIRGNKGNVLFSGDSAQVIPERAYADEVEAETVKLNSNGEKIEDHHKNWLAAIRENKETNCNIDLAVRVQTMITLGEMAYRHNTTFTFDPKTRTTTPDIKKFMVAQKV